MNEWIFSWCDYLRGSVLLCKIETKIHSFIHSFEYRTDITEKIHHQSNLLYGVSTKGNNNNSMQDAYNTNCKLPVDVDETTVLYIRFT